MSSTETAPPAPSEQLAKTDASTLQQVSSLQMQNSELMKQRADLESALKEREADFQKLKESYAKEREELIQVQKNEMQKQFSAFMKDWISSLEGQNPTVVENLKTGVEQMMNEGRSKDRVWEILCCASEAHHRNVTTIEELRKQNNEQHSRITDLQEQYDKIRGFEEPRKRTRVDDPVNHGTVPPPAAAHDIARPAVQDSDVWGQFENLMNSRPSQFF